MDVLKVKQIATSFDKQLDSFERSGCGGEVMMMKRMMLKCT